jgi:hypothetical protein
VSERLGSSMLEVNDQLASVGPKVLGSCRDGLANKTNDLRFLFSVTTAFHVKALLV